MFGLMQTQKIVFWNRDVRFQIRTLSPVNVFTLAFDRFYAFSMNKSINFYQFILVYINR